MSGGLMQLVAYGAQDVFLTGNPQITFFKVVYRRHTNFSMESIEQTFNGTADFGKKVNVTVSRNGDLITKCYVRCVIPDVTVTDTANTSFEWIPELGHFLIKEVEVEIGGQKIDKHYGTWLSIWAALTVSKGHEDGYATMVGPASLSTATTTTAGGDPDTHPGATLHIPLQFWFCRHTGLALPLIALQYHEVKFQIQFESFANLNIQSGDTIASPGLGDCSLYIDYIYLDTDERRRFAQVSHEYLIEQLQFTGDESLSGTNNKLKLNFNHPVKELLWVVQDDNRSFGNFTDVDGTKGELSPAAGVNPVSTAKLLLNGHDRFSQRDGRYFNTVQPIQHHTNTPREGINVYSFAMKPEEQQPSGSANMSRIDNAQLSVVLTAAGASANNPTAKVYATNYNILRITSGMGGLAYAN